MILEPPIFAPRQISFVSNPTGDGNYNSTVRSEELNLSTRGQWELFRSHRDQIEQLILRHLPQQHPLLLESPATRLCALGAGNCNDLDLRFLRDRVGELHLLDIDAAALKAAAVRQRTADAPNVFRHAPIDLTADARLCERIGRFDIVLSSCVLSQLIAGVRSRLGAGHLRFAQERAATIAHHLRLMLDLLAPGGRAILINDVVSSDTLPQLRQVPPDHLPGLMRTLVAEGKTFRGLDPAAMSTAIDQLPFAVSRQQFPPWLWHLSALRSYLVYGIVFSVQQGARRRVCSQL